MLDPDADDRRNAHITRIHELALERRLVLGRDERVLDFGAGTGRLLGLLAARAGEAVGAEISPGMAQRATASLAGVPNARVEVFDGRRLPFEDGSFDAAVAVLVLQLYFSEPDRLAEHVTDIARVLRPEGRLWLLERAGPPGEEAWTRERWGEALAGAGLRLRRAEGVRGYRPTPVTAAVERGLWPARALGRAAALDLAWARRRGVRAPYTECLFEAVRE